MSRKQEYKNEITTSLTPRRIYEYLDKYVIGQDRSKKVLSIASYNHLKRLQYFYTFRKTTLRKSNILLIGPSGSGKTHLARNLAECLKVPFSIADATEFTEAGYYGKDVEVMIGELLHKTGLNPEDTEKGIVFIDEIDKIARRGETAKTGAGTRDIGGEGVQQSLLKIVEGQKIYVPYNVTQHWNKHDFVEIDTSNILFIGAGCFDGIERSKQKNSIGFTEKYKRNKGANSITNEDLRKYGLIPELLGRFPVKVELDELNKEDLKKILTVPPDSIIKEYTELLAIDDIKLTIHSTAIDSIVDYAIEQKIGARGLRSIIEIVMEDIMFEAPEMKKKTVKITKKYVDKALSNVEGDLAFTE